MVKHCCTTFVEDKIAMVFEFLENFHVFFNQNTNKFDLDGVLVFLCLLLDW